MRKLRGKSLAVALALCACTKQFAPEIPQSPKVEERMDNTIEAPQDRYFTCRYDKGILSYATERGMKSVELDYKLEPDAVICSDSYTVLIGDERIIVAIGEKKMKENVNFLGFVDGVFDSANSYAIIIDPDILSEGIKEISLNGTTLEIRTGSSVWSTDIQSPKEWDVQKTM